MSVKFLLVVVVLAIGHDTHTAQSCTLVGNTDHMERSQSTVEGLFLDLQNPAPCNGTVTAWNYCFYRIESASDINYIVDFVVYRRTGSGGNYELMETRTVDMSGVQLAALNSDFTCNILLLEESEMFEIQENDVLGACLNNVGNNQKMLDILAESVTNTLYVTDGCIQSGVDIPTRIIRNQLATSPSFALHLFVDVTQPPPSTSLTYNAVFPGLTSTPAGLVAASTAGNALIDPSQDSMVSSSTPSFLRIPGSSSAEIPGAINRISRSFSAEISLVSFPVDSATLSPTMDQPQPPAGGLNVGIVAAVVIVVLVLGVSAVVVVGIIVCCMRQRRYTVKGANIHSGIASTVVSAVGNTRHGTVVMSGGASEIKNIPVAECMAYGIRDTHQAGERDVSVRQCLAYGVFEGQQMRKAEDDDYETDVGGNVLITFSQGTAVMSGGASEIKNVPMAECMAYGIHDTHQAGERDVSVSQCLAYGVFEGQQMRKTEDDDYETVEGDNYEPIPN